jgi:hypothetical protein
VNVFGADVSRLDVDLFLTAARQLFPVLAVLWLAALLRVRRAWWLLLGVLLANAYVWLETTWPLQRLYALGPSNDRLNNVAMVQAVAAGGSPLYTAQVGHMQFEPLWSVVMAVLSGFDPGRLLAVYAWMPLVMAAGTALSLYCALRPWSPWERAVVAGTATLLLSDPLDFTSAYRVPWAMTFLLKPNHAVGLVLVPWVVRRIATIQGWRDRVLAALLLHLLGWAFVIHMGAVCVGLAAFVALAVWTRRTDARRDAIDVAWVIGLNLLVVSPYLVMLFVGYGVFQSGPRLEIPPNTAHLLEATTRTALLFALGVHGAVVAYRRDRMGRLWAGQLVGAFVLWLSYFALHLLQQAKERDDAFYWLRFLVAVCAGIGAWDLVTRAAAILPDAARRWSAAWARPEVRAAALALVMVPASLPYWYEPRTMDVYFTGSLEPVPPAIAEPVQALLRRRESVGVLAGDRAASRWAAALAGFRVLMAKDFPSPRDYGARVDAVESVLRGEGHAALARYGVTHLLVTRDLLALHPGATLEGIESRSDLDLVAISGDRHGDFTAVFELVRPAG